MEMLSVLEDCADAWPTSTSMAPYAVRLGKQNWSTACLFEENKVPKIVLLSFGSEEEETGKYL